MMRWVQINSNWSCEGSFIIFFLEGLDVLDVLDVVLHVVEGGQGLCGNGVAKILLHLHCDFNGIEGVESVVGEGAISGDTWVGEGVPFL